MCNIAPMTLSAPNTTHDDPLADAALAAARLTQAARDVERALVFGDGGRLRRAIDEARQALQVLACAEGAP